jgi:glycosyltransferase involved in cell wall biosynthesis
MKRPQSVMLVTQAFPPEAVVGAHRMLALCRHLIEQNYQVSVITSHAPHDAAVDEQLTQMIPPGVKVISTAGFDLPLLAARILKPRFLRHTNKTMVSHVCHSFAMLKDKSERSEESQFVGGGETLRSAQGDKKRLRTTIDWLSWWLHIPDSSTGWVPTAVAAGLVQAIRSYPEVIFSSAPPWSSFLAGALISRILGVPLVADFRDPWCGSAFQKIPYPAHRSVNSLLEKMVVRHSKRITCAWDGIRKHLIQGYPRRTKDICTILNGFNPELLGSIEPASIDTERKVFLHSGGFYGPRSPEPMLAALQYLKEQAPEAASRVLIVFLGPTTYNGQPIELMAQKYGVLDYVRIMPRVAHRDALGYLKGADAALLFGQSGSEALATIPAKTLEYIGLRKSVLAIGAGEEVCDVIRRGGCPIWQLPADDPVPIASVMIEILDSKVLDSPGGLNDNVTLSQAYMAQQIERVIVNSCN